MRYSVLPWLFLITTTTIVVVSIFFCIPVESQCLEHQKSLLLQLKKSLIFDSSLSTKLVLWNHNTDCCEWGGVTCDDDTGYVVGLDLSFESISGGIINNSSSLFSLRHLQRLNLANNVFFPSHISSGFEKLSSLTYLNLSNAGFSGQIPIGISHLTRLVSLDLSVYLPWGYNLEVGNSNLKLLVQNLTELTELCLDYVNISSKGEEWCEAISSSLPNLQVLSLSGCDLSGPLCSSLENLQSLSVIHLSENNLSAPLPNFFAKFTNLTELYLYNSNLQGTFPKNIFHIQTLRTLSLAYNELLEGSFPEFSQNGSLQTLILSYTNFSGRFPDSIGNLRMLSTIHVHNCSFTGPIPSSLANLTQLVSLYLSYNMFIGSIPSSMANLTQLVYLDLSCNMFIGPIPSAEGLSNLVSIDLSHNSLSGSIPSSLFELPSLDTIDLSFNQFDGQVDEFSNASSSLLYSIDLSINNLQGSVPTSFFKLGRLTNLVINSNNFSGTIQLEKFYRLSNLSFLDLSYNSLSIHITSGTSSSLSSVPQFVRLLLASCKLQSFPDLKNQSRLEQLDLSDNQIEGKIPNWIWKVGNGGLYYLNLSHNLLSDFQEPYVILLSDLSVLDLHSNQLHGEIPIPRGSVQYLDFSSNSFSSFIPPTIGNVLTDAYFFSLSNNNISGNIPQSICKMGNLEVLDLSNNRLNGTIPSCLIQRSTSTLGVLNLRNNRFSGNILSIFPKNCSLQTLDLNGNHLEGRVPKSLSNCRGMEVLNLGNNMISDRFPCFLENISSLHVLVLRSNRFQGDINCQGRNNESLWNLQIIDLAFNNFGGALSSSFFSNWKAMMTDEDNAQPKLNNLGYYFGYSEYYSNRVDVIYKGIYVELVKVLTIFTSIDLSSNRFEGKIPDTVENLKSLVLLNLSHNAFKGSIPTSLGNLKKLESLDLSQNMLIEMIPTQLASLTFLSVFNVSYNLLVGRIPTGPQFQTFSETSFLGNPGLCGFPLNVSCNNTEVAQDSPLVFKDRHSIFETEVYLSAALGFIVGLAIIIWPLVFSKRWRQWYYKHMDQIFMKRIIQKGSYRNPIRRL